MASVPPKQWEPSFDQGAIREAIGKYTLNPEMFDDEQVKELETHASHYRVPFARSAQDQEAFLTKVITNLGKGFIEGFTTIPTEKMGGEHPTDTVEGISRNLGHLAGFVGYVPGARWIPALRVLRGRSIPMAGATAVQKRLGKVFKPAMQEAGPWAQKFAKGTVLSDMAGGAFHLGTASAISSWTEGIDAMVESAGFGATFGAVFRGIGNMPGFGKRLSATQLNQTSGAPVLSKLSGGQKLDLSLRTLAGSMFQGLPSSMQGATTEEQVYAYLMGAFFGFKETPLSTRTSREFLHKFMKDKEGDLPEDHPEFKNYTPEMQEIIKNDFQYWFGPEETRSLAFKLAKEGGITMEDLEVEAKKLGVEVAEDPVTQEMFLAPTKSMLEELKARRIGEGASEDQHDIDMHAHYEDFRTKGASVYGFVEREASPAWVDGKPADVKKLQVSLEVWEKWKSLHKTKKGDIERPVPGASEEMVRFFSQKYGVNFTKEQAGWWRAFSEQNRKKERVRHLTMVDGQPEYLPVHGINKAGNQKKIWFEPPLIQRMFEKMLNLPQEQLKPFYTMYEHLIVDGKEMNLSEARDTYFEAAKKRIQKQAADRSEKIMGDELKEMAERAADRQVATQLSRLIDFADKENYYYIGGKGDNKRMYFVQYHPKMRGDIKSLNARIKELKRAYARAPKEVRMQPAEFDKAMAIGLKNFKNYMYFEGKGGGTDAALRYKKAFVSNMMYDLTWNGVDVPMDKPLDMRAILKDGYLNASRTPAKAYNKRAQIWFNTGLTANQNYIKNLVKDTIDGRAFRYIAFKDAKNPAEVPVGLQAQLNTEATDGGPMARRDVIDALNTDKGLPTSGGTNKSFIVSSPDIKLMEGEKGLGAVLGKYMFHTPSKAIEEWMHQEKIHMIFPESALKQVGGRKVIPFNVWNSTAEVNIAEYGYRLPIHNIRTIMSEITSNKSIKSQRMPKQMFSTLSLFGYRDIDGATAKDMITSLMGRTSRGVPEVNGFLKEYKSTLDPVLENKLIERLDELSVTSLLDIMRDPEHSAFAQKAYKKILRLNQEVVSEMVEEGEYSRQEAMEEAKVNMEFQGVLDRLTNLYPEGNVGAYLHKWMKGYRMVAMRNYIVNSMSKPKIANAASARMRPIDAGMREEIKNMDDKTFFLGDSHGDKYLEDPILQNGGGKLKDIYYEWKEGKKGAYRDHQEEVAQIMEAVVLRVPMDSPSGAHVLKFGGFTGIKDYGIITHGRTMRALGGADLDGDKAHILYGGEGGLKPEWKEMYRAQRNEYIKGEKGSEVEMHNKNEIDPQNGMTYRQQLIMNDPEVMKQAEAPQTYYDPYWRYFMSEGAHTGRDSLKRAVVGRSKIIGAYNAIRATEKPQTWWMTLKVENKKGDLEDVSVRARITQDAYYVPYVFNKRTVKMAVFRVKKGEEDLERFRNMARTATALGSDPMDEAGLIPPAEMTKKMLDSLFSYEIHNYDTKTHGNFKNEGLTAETDGKHNIRFRGLHSSFGDINNLLYGHNWNTGRRHSYADIAKGMYKLDFLPENSRNTFLPQLAEQLKGLNWSDNIFRRVDFDVLKKMYDDNHEAVQGKEWLRDLLNRKSIGTPWAVLVGEVRKRKLYDPDVRKRYVDDDKLWDEIYKISYATNKDGEKLFTLGNPNLPSEVWNIYGQKPDNLNFRKAWLDAVAYKAEDFVINDLSDMTTIKRLTDIVEKGNFLPSRVAEIHSLTEFVKNQHAMRSKQRKEIPVDVQETIYDDKSYGDARSAKTDQLGIDSIVRRHKGNMNAGEKELYDTLLLGTFQKSNLNKIAELQQLDNPSKDQELMLGHLEKAANNTSLVQVGLSSSAVSDVSVKKFFDEYDKLWKKAFEKPSKEDVELIDGVFHKKKKTKLLGDDGKIVEGSIIEESDLDIGTRKYLDEIHPFVGLHKGKVKDPELKEAYYEIKDALKNMHNSDAMNLNFLFRTITGKNLNKANKMDILDFSRYLKHLNTPSFWRRSWDFMTGKSDEIKRVYYWQFPAAIDRNLQKSPAMRQLKETMSPYRDHLGNTIMGKGLIPMSPIGEIQNFSSKNIELSMQQIDEEKSTLRDKLSPYVASIEEGDILHDLAIVTRERGMKDILHTNPKENPVLLNHHQMIYENNFTQMRPQYQAVKDKIYRIVVDGNVELKTGQDIIQSINKIYTTQNEKMHSLLTGQTDKIEKWLSHARDANGKETWAGLDKLRWKWTTYMNGLMRDGKRIPIEELGIDGVRQVAKRIMESYTPEKMRTPENLAKMRERMRVNEEWDVTKKLPFQSYFPHISFDRKVADKNLNAAIEYVMKTSDLTKEERNRALAKLVTHHKQLTGDLIDTTMGENFDAMQEVMTNMATGKKKKAQNILSGSLKKVGSQFTRSAHIGGWDRTPEAYENYMKNIIKTFYDQTMQVANRTTINEFYKNFTKGGKNQELGSKWVNFFKLYAQGAMGYPVHIPEKVMNDPAMKIKKTPYKWFADSQTKKRIDNIRKKLGVARKTLKKWKLDDETIDELAGVEYGQLNSWSALEAKYELAALLAHPKSMIANLYGGTAHTVMSTGVGNWRNARNFEYLKTHVNPEWKGMQDVQKWLQKLGITEEFLIYEAGLNPNIKSKRYQSFVKEVTAKLKKDPNMADTTLLELKRKYKLTDTMWNFAASFMRIPERTLRRDAFMSHYLQAREKFGNAIKDYDHPFLIEMAKRGVKATQFLYSAPHRPMWTNSALGRVFSRFQLWSWNSVRFRNDTIREAKLHGYQPGTESFDRLKRTAQADMFMLGMSNLFLYSLFENALPAPWNWFQDTADWLLGDDKARERAFYGSPFGPLQMITPPVLRLLPPMFKGMINDDWSKLTDYYLWTMMPFGRMIRDVAGPGGAIENPYYAVTKLTGLPILELGELFRGEDDEAE